jgi:hypothetical protein
MEHRGKSRLEAGHSESEAIRFSSALEEALRVIESAMAHVEDWGKPALKQHVEMAMQVIGSQVHDYAAISRPVAVITFLVATPRPGPTAGMSNHAAEELRTAVAAAEPSELARALGRSLK